MLINFGEGEGVGFVTYQEGVGCRVSGIRFEDQKGFDPVDGIQAIWKWYGSFLIYFP